MSNKLQDKRILKILVSNAFLRAGRIVFKLFLNLYIWKQTEGDIKFLALFNIIYLTFHGATFIGFSSIVKQSSRRNLSHIISILGYIIIYSIIIFLGPKIIDYAFLFAMILGFFNGIYWINYHTNAFEFTNFKNRGNFEGIKNTLQILVGIIVPSLIGFIITFDFFSLGYEIAFTIGVLFLIVTLFTGLEKFEEREKEKTYFVDTFKKCVKDKDIFRSLYTYTLSGFSYSNTLLEVLIPVIIFSRVGRELDVGLIVSVFSLISMGGAYLFGRFVNYTYYRGTIIVSGILYALCLWGFIAFPYTSTMIIFSSLFNFFLVFFNLPQKVISDNVLHKIKDYKNRRVEYMVVREVFLFVGRISGFFLLYCIDSLDVNKVKYIFYMMIFLTFIAVYSLSRIDLDRVEKDLKKDEKDFIPD
ncbi:MFS transporter [Candidatus Gracilibacteria bacterium]|nr:MFS transporter [Candidatus Gracilibacteria bacterium]NUJ99379.1 MFS transporter [Candidatus Gracilibacteria bacterium]